nr:aminopeptidase P family N-terminal domain-containing protein [Halococcus hamelinensis]
MDPDLSALDTALDDADADGYLLNADADDPDQRYLSGFTAPDPFVTLYDGGTHLLVSALEYGRARGESRAETVSRHAEYTDGAGSREAGHVVLAAFLDDHDVASVLVPPRFPVGTADGLREEGIEVTAEEGSVVTWATSFSRHSSTTTTSPRCSSRPGSRSGPPTASARRGSR